MSILKGGGLNEMLEQIKLNSGAIKRNTGNKKYSYNQYFTVIKLNAGTS